METITTIWVVSSLALVFSILLTPVSMRLAHWWGALDHPCERSVHKAAIPRLGGVGIILSLLIAASFYLSFNALTIAYLTGLFIIAITGLIDDIRPISHRFKFLGEIAAVVAFLMISGSQLSGIGDLFGFGEINFGSASFMITLFCMVGVINSMNLSDGLDGLAGGLAIIASLFFAFLAYLGGQGDCLIIAIAMAGALLGFLLYNGFPARLFMGDVGSLVIGYTCAVLAVQLVNKPSVSDLQPITIALIMAVPLLDTIVVMGSRMLRGHGPFMPDKTHLHHRLLGLGLSQNQVVSMIYALMFAYGMAAMLWMHAPAYAQFYLAIVASLLIYQLISFYSQSPYRLIAFVSGLSRWVSNSERYLVSKLYGINGSVARLFSHLLVVLLLLPALFLRAEQALVVILPACLLLGLMVVMRHRNGRIQALIHGLLYLCVLSVLFIYATELQDQYWAYYERFLISVSLAWVVMSLLVSHTRRLLALHSFEILLVMISWICFFIVIPMLDFVPTDGQDVRLICVYAIPLLLVIKLSISKGFGEGMVKMKTDWRGNAQFR